MAHTDKVTDLTTDETDNADNVSAKRQKMTATPIAVIVMNDPGAEEYGSRIFVNRSGNLTPEMEWILMRMRMGIDPLSNKIFQIFSLIVCVKDPTAEELVRHAKAISKQQSSVDEAFLRRACNDHKWWKSMNEKEFNTETGALNTSMRVILVEGGAFLPLQL
jgi:hypothetical protein